MNNKNKNRDKIATLIEKNTLGLSAKVISEKLGIQIRTVQRALKDLELERLIKAEGQGPARTYKSLGYLPVQYNPDFLENIVKLKVFSKLELQKLDQLAKNTGETIALETYSAQIFERLIIDLSWSSSSLEGNTYSLLETEKLILNDEVSSKRSETETQMILNHKEAIKFLIYGKKKLNLSSHSLKSVHALLSQGLLSNPAAEGALRKIPVGIEGTRYLPLDIPQQIEDEFQKFFKICGKIKHPVLQSFLILAFIPYLQPFEDLNKRTSRIACNIPLIINNYVPISFLNIKRAEYLSALKMVYEFNDFEELKQVFLKSYIYAVEQYRYVKKTLKKPDPLGIKYRDLIKTIIHDIITQKRKLESKDLVEVKTIHRAKVKNIVKGELDSVHAENIVRFNITAKQFRAWKGR